MSQGTDQKFVELIRFAPGSQRGAKSTLVSGEAAFGLGAMTVLAVGKAVMHHPAISAFGRARRVSWIERNHGAANPEFLPAQHVVVFSVVTLVSQQAARTKISGRLSYGGGEVGRVLSRTTRRNSTHNQLRGRMKHGRELRPRGVHRFGSAATTLEVH